MMQATRAASKPSKQRKMLHAAPDHVRYKFFASALSPQLKSSHGANALPVRSGDTVRILRGDHKGFEGKISRIDRKRYRIYVEGLTREKVDGTAIFVPVHPSKVMITNLNLEDKWRKKILERKKALMKIEAPPEKPRKIVTEERIEEKAVEEGKPKEKKKRVTRKKTVKAPTAAKRAEQKVEKVEEEERPKTRKPRAKRKTVKKARKTEGGT